MSIFEKTPLDRVRAKCEQIEGELKKHPDFQLYLITETIKDRTRMKRLLMKIPNFRLWYLLTNAIAAFENSCTAARIALHSRRHFGASKTHRCKLGSHCGKRRHVAVEERIGGMFAVATGDVQNRAASTNITRRGHLAHS